MITLGSLFDGIGGFPLAGIRNDIVTLWGSEIEPFPIRVTKIRFPDMKHLGDITKINGAEIESVDVITFGSPCQDLSVAGKRAGLAGERSGLFMEAIRIIREMRDANKLWNTNDVCTERSNGNYAADSSRISRNGICGSSGGDSNEKCNVRADIDIRPRFAVWENVPGAFSSNKGEDFRAVLEETARVADETVTIPRPPKCKWNTSGTIMGNGWSIAWRVLDAQYWGVPQRRRRIFLVADFGGQSAPEVLFKREGLRRHIAEGGDTREGTAADVERGFRETGPGYWGEGIGCLRAEGENRPSRPSNVIVNATVWDARGNGDGKTSSCITGDHQNRVTDYTVVAVHQNASGEVRQNKVANTLNTNSNASSRNAPLIAGTVSSKWAKGTGGPAGDEHYNLIVAGLDCRNGLENGDISGTIQKNGNSLNAIHPVRVGYTVRRLTPLECERLQDYPDFWTDISGTTEATKEELNWWREVWLTWDKVQAENPEKVKPRTDKNILKWLKNPTSDSSQYKALGNSVAVCCPEYVLEGIKEVIERGQIS
jgi:DNA (cytosine-5)-methyltransferase 1